MREEPILAETVISPNGEGAAQVGTLIDDKGARYAVLRFQDGDADPVIVTFTPDGFRALAAQMAKTIARLDDETYWQNHKR